MFRGTTFQLFVQATILASLMCVAKAVADWHQFSAAPLKVISAVVAGVYIVAAVIIAWRFIGTRYLDRK